MSEFTKGPWTKREMVGVGFPGQVGYAIDYNEDQEQVVDYVYEEADADLICAAPDLLEACEMLIEGMDACGISGPYLDQARLAVSKAKGETK